MYILLLFIGLTLFFGCIFFHLKVKFPYTLWVGVTFFGLIVHLILGILFSLGIHPIQEGLRGIALFFIPLIVLLPVLSFTAFIVYGIYRQWEGGFKWINTIPIIAGLSLISYLISWPMIFDLSVHHVLNILFSIVLSGTTYFVLVFFFYTLTNLLNLVPFQPEKVDYFIILGAALDGDQVTPILASRIQKGIELLKEQDAGKLILSGGQGEDEWVPEGEAMFEYALKQGIDHKILFRETESRNTRQNIQFSKEIIDVDWSSDKEPVIAIVTNNYHVLRALRQAENIGIPTIGYGSNAKFFYSLNGFFREFIAYLDMTFKIHATVIGFLGIILVGLFIFFEFIS